MDYYCDEVLSGRVKVDLLVETAQVLAFHHTHPYWPVHVVVIPRKHIPSLAEAEPDDMPIVHELTAVAAELCRRLAAQHGGCRLSTNCGTYQTNRHLHFYIHHGDRLADQHLAAND